jgi:hypothetical protein
MVEYAEEKPSRAMAIPRTDKRYFQVASMERALRLKYINGPL